MKKTILLFSFISLFATAQNQVIKGSVLDKKTKNPILFASIYFNGTFNGATSDENGNFEFNIAKTHSMPLTISAVGYYSTTLSDYATDEALIIYLKPKIFVLNEVDIHSKSLVKKRKKNLRTFKEIFLGTGNNAASCKILNEEDITFNYESDRDTLKAFASKPILITNNALGYEISYALDKFEYHKKNQTFLFKGNYIFKKDFELDEKDKQDYETRRKETYLGSRMHFFRALWRNDLKSAGFVVKNSEGEELKYEDMVIHKDTYLKDAIYRYKRFFTSPIKLNIYYTDLSSIVIFFKKEVFFNEIGYFAEGIEWGGEMIKKRTGDLLPYEYEMK